MSGTIQGLGDIAAREAPPHGALTGSKQRYKLNNIILGRGKCFYENGRKGYHIGLF